jgi:hypothetical protein
VERARGAVEQATERLLQRLLCTVAELDARFSSKFLATLASKAERAEHVSYYCEEFNGQFQQARTGIKWEQMKLE